MVWGNGVGGIGKEEREGRTEPLKVEYVAIEGSERRWWVFPKRTQGQKHDCTPGVCASQFYALFKVIDCRWRCAGVWEVGERGKGERKLGKRKGKW